MWGVWFAVLTCMALTALAGARLSPTPQGRWIELVVISAMFVAGWLLDSSLAWLDPIRVSVLIVSSYVLSRIGVAHDGSIAHLLPCSALALSAAATGSMSLGTCLLPIVVGHVATRSPRWTVLTTFVGLAQAVIVLR